MDEKDSNMEVEFTKEVEILKQRNFVHEGQIPTWRGGGHDVSPEGRSYWHLWFLGHGEFVFFNDVTPSEFPVPLGIGPEDYTHNKD